VSLRDEDIVTTKLSSRRSFLSRVGTVVLGSAAVILGSGSAPAREIGDTDTGRPPDNKAGKNPDHDKREPGDPKKKEKTKDSDQGRAADNKAGKNPDSDKRERGDPK
jgi:hypothetical protein